MINPNNNEYEKIFNAAVSYHKQEMFSEAKNLYQEILISFDDPAVHYLIGLLHSQEKDYIRAIYHLEKSAAAQRVNPDWFNALALCYQKTGKLKIAEQFAQIATSIDPKHPNYLNRYCKILNEERNFEKSVELMQSFLKKNNFIEGYVTLAFGLKSLDESFLAARNLIKALRLNENCPIIIFNLADNLINIGRLKSAEKLLQELIAHDYQVAESLSLLAIVKREQGKYEEALKYIEKARSLSSNNPMINWNYSLLLLLNKNDKGWRFYDSGFDCNQRRLVNKNIPLWDGRDITNNSLIIFGEQGLGDQIMHASQLKILEKHAKKITIVCDDRLEKLFITSFPNFTILPSSLESKINPSKYDYMIMSASLLPIFYKNKWAISSNRRFLDVPKVENTLKLPNDHQLHVGFAFKGGTTKKDQRKRSININTWNPLFEIPNIKFYCLQHALNQKETDLLGQNTNIVMTNFIQENKNITNVANVISQLDLVITVDNTVAHLAAGLGIPTWCLIPYSPDWRWKNEGLRSQWYKSIRLYRQKSINNWQMPIESVKNELLQFRDISES